MDTKHITQSAQLGWGAPLLLCLLSACINAGHKMPAIRQRRGKPGLVRCRRAHRYEKSFLPKIGPVALYGLLFTVVVLFALQGHKITSEPTSVARIALPLLAYFAIMWSGGFAIGRRLHLSYGRTVALAFSAASNDFELAIAVAIGVFGVTSGQALAGVVGPLIEVPVLLGLVYVALWPARHFYPTESKGGPPLWPYAATAGPGSAPTTPTLKSTG